MLKPHSLLLALTLFWSDSSHPIEAPLVQSGGVYTLPVTLNGVLRLNFILDSGASDVNIPNEVAIQLLHSGTISKTDFLPGKVYELADGSHVKSERLLLKSIEVGGLTITNVPASVGGSGSSLLLGQSFFKRLPGWSIDNDRHVLVLGKNQDTSALDVHFYYLQGENFFNLRNYKDAIFMFKKAAELGYAPAQSYLASMYRDGIGVDKNTKLALELYLKAAKQGLAVAQYNAGEILYYDLKERNIDESVRWYQMAAENGYSEAYNALAFMYLDGGVVPENFSKGMELLKKGSKAGNAKSEAFIGSLYFWGIKGAPLDYELAIQHLLHAEEMGGDEQSKYVLGYAYMNGFGVPKSFNKAREYFSDPSIRSSGLQEEVAQLLKQLDK